MKALEHPVIGELVPHWCSEMLNSPFMEFHCDIGIDGLAKVDEDGTLNLLSVIAAHERCGYFREFIRQCKQHYKSIRVWAVMNDVMPVLLTRYGFVKGHDMGFDGRMEEVWDWVAPKDSPAKNS